MRLLGWLGGAVIVGLASFFIIQPGRGLFELERTRAAVRAATSWHLEGEATSPDGAHWRVVKSIVCPKDGRIREERTDGTGAVRVSEVAFLGGRYYSRQLGGGWLQGEGPDERQPDCMEGGPVLPAIGSLFGNLRDAGANGTIAKGELTVVGADPCRNWHVTFPGEPGLDRSYTICVGEADQLPRRVVFPGVEGAFDFSHWNATTIAVPE